MQSAGVALMTPEIIEHVAGVLESSGGGDAWWTKPLEELLPESLRIRPAVCGGARTPWMCEFLFLI